MKEYYEKFEKQERKQRAEWCSIHK